MGRVEFINQIKKFEVQEAGTSMVNVYERNTTGSWFKTKFLRSKCSETNLKYKEPVEISVKEIKEIINDGYKIVKNGGTMDFYHTPVIGELVAYPMELIMNIADITIYINQEPIRFEVDDLSVSAIIFLIEYNFNEDIGTSHFTINKVRKNKKKLIVKKREDKKEVNKEEDKKDKEDKKKDKLKEEKKKDKEDKKEKLKEENKDKEEVEEVINKFEPITATQQQQATMADAAESI
jgi:hypothetical protein